MLEGDERFGVVGQLEREAVGAALDRTRQLTRDDAEQASDGSASKRERWQRRALASNPSVEALRQLSSCAGRGRRDEGAIEEAPRDVAVSDVRELMSHDEARLGWGEATYQRVEEHHAAGSAKTCNVGVDGGASPTGVDLEHLADPHTGTFGDLQHFAAQIAGWQWREVVEDRIKQHWAGEGRDARDGDDASGRRKPPLIPEAAHERAGERRAASAERGPERTRSQHVGRPPPPGLRRQPGVERPLARQRVERQRHSREGQRERRTSCPGSLGAFAAQRRAGAATHEQDKRCGVQRLVRGVQHLLGTRVLPCPVDDLGGEISLGRSRRCPDRPGPRSQCQSAGLRARRGEHERGGPGTV